MRIWSLHPALLDQKGLVACWRETLLAQKVLLGRTKGYCNHPQLERFKALADPISGIGTYLLGIYNESLQRGYTFDSSKIVRVDNSVLIPVTKGQLNYEFNHLKSKLQVRDPIRLKDLNMRHHQMFNVIDGSIEKWEKIISPSNIPVFP